MLAYQYYIQSVSTQVYVSRLRDLVKDSDAIFLLNDIRESRRLPTDMSRALGNMLLNASLGLDECLIMQHNVSGSASNCMGCSFYTPRELHAEQDR